MEISLVNFKKGFSDDIFSSMINKLAEFLEDTSEVVKENYEIIRLYPWYKS